MMVLKTSFHFDRIRMFALSQCFNGADWIGENEKVDFIEDQCVSVASILQWATRPSVVYLLGSCLVKLYRTFASNDKLHFANWKPIPDGILNEHFSTVAKTPWWILSDALDANGFIKIDFLWFQIHVFIFLFEYRTEEFHQTPTMSEYTSRKRSQTLTVPQNLQRRHEREPDEIFYLAWFHGSGNARNFLLRHDRGSFVAPSPIFCSEAFYTQSIRI